MTQAEILRRTRRRRFLGMLAVLAVLAIGAFVSVNLLFKVAIFRVENFDHSTPADTGIYTEDEIVSALNIEKTPTFSPSPLPKRPRNYRRSSRIWTRWK